MWSPNHNRVIDSRIGKSQSSKISMTDSSKKFLIQWFVSEGFNFNSLPILTYPNLSKARQSLIPEIILMNLSLLFQGLSFFQSIWLPLKLPKILSKALSLTKWCLALDAKLRWAHLSNGRSSRLTFKGCRDTDRQSRARCKCEPRSSERSKNSRWRSPMSKMVSSPGRTMTSVLSS